MTSVDNVEVVVVGGGPAGAAAATTLARDGRRVLLADKASFPRDKCCGDGLTTGALRRLEMLELDPSNIASFRKVDDLALVSPSGRQEVLPLGRGDGIFAAVARRVDLDAALLDVARRAGAVVEEGCQFTGIERNGEGLTVTFGARVIHTRYLIAADGAWSPVRRAIEEQTSDPRWAREHRRDRGPGEWHAFRSYATSVSSAASEALTVIFEERLLPGYAWSFPLGEGQANVGICLRRGPGVRGRELAYAWNETLESPALRQVIGDKARFDEPVRTWPIPAGIETHSLSRWAGLVLFAGDAARAADPFTGEGIAQALETGTAAAVAITAHLDHPERVQQAYERRVGALATEQHIASALSMLMTRSIAARGAVAVSGARPRLAGLVGRWLFEGYPRLILLRPRLWRRGVFSEPGSFLDRSDPVPIERAKAHHTEKTDSRRDNPAELDAE